MEGWCLRTILPPEVILGNPAEAFHPVFKPEALDDLKAQLKMAMKRLVAIEKAISGLAD